MCNDTYLLDSGCTNSIVCSQTYLVNLREMQPKTVKGLTGYKTYKWQGDLRLPLTDTNGRAHVMIIADVTYDPEGEVNLIATDDLTDVNWDCNFSD